MLRTRNQQRLSGNGQQLQRLDINNPSRRRLSAPVNNLRADLERARGNSPPRVLQPNGGASSAPPGEASAGLNHRLTSPAGASVLSIATANVAMLKEPLTGKSLERLLNDMTSARTNGAQVNHPSQHFPRTVLQQVEMRRKAPTSKPTRTMHC